MTALETLVDARDWLAVGPERWCQGTSFRRADGSAAGVPEMAASACVIGAMDMHTSRRSDLVCAVRALEKAIPFPADKWNDSLPPGRAGWEQVIAAFGKAIDAEKARGDE